MKFNLFIISIFVSFTSISQNEVKRNIYYGNSAFHSENYEEAMSYYEQAIIESPFNYKANYNMATTYFKLELFDKAIEKYDGLINQTNDPNKKAMLFHNLGNCNLANQKLDDAIDSYKSSLRLNPFSEETRYNLAYALELKKEQEKKQQKNKDQNNEENQGENSENNANSNQNENDSEGNEDKQNNNENSEENNSDKPEEKEAEESNNEESDEQNSSQQKDENNKMSEGKKNALKVLEEANKKEKEVQEMMIKSKNGKNSKSSNTSTTKKDW